MIFFFIGNRKSIKEEEYNDILSDTLFLYNGSIKTFFRTSSTNATAIRSSKIDWVSGNTRFQG